MFPIGFRDGVFTTQPLTMVVRRSNVTSQTRDDMRWSLTEVHEDLVSFWAVTILVRVRRG